MAKKAKVAELPQPVGEMPITARMPMNQEQAGKCSIGEEMSCMISGKCVGISRKYDDKTKYDVEIENPKVSDVEVNEANRALKRMMEK